MSLEIKENSDRDLAVKINELAEKFIMEMASINADLDTQNQCLGKVIIHLMRERQVQSNEHLRKLNTLNESMASLRAMLGEFSSVNGGSNNDNKLN